MRNKLQRSPRHPHALAALLFKTTVLAGLPAAATAQPLPPLPAVCGEWRIPGKVNPLDYRKHDPRLQVVEDYHFTPMVEALVRPMFRGGTFGADLDYTLIAYPNHHRALATLVRLSQRERTDQPAGSSFTVDCYFVRALKLAPDDRVARLLYAQYLGSKGRRDDAMTQLKAVVEQADNGLTHYNAGLLFLELGAFPEAVRQAQRAVELGYSRRDLADELRKRGKWPVEPVPSDAGNRAAPLVDSPSPAEAGTKPPG